MNIKDELHLRINAVDDALVKATNEWTSAAVSVSNWLGADGGGREANLHALQTVYRPAIEKWQARGRNLANGEAMAHAKGAQWALDAWVDEGNGLLENLDRVAKDSTFSRLDRMIVDTVVASAKDVGEGVATAAVFVRRRWLWLVAVAVLLLVLVYLPGVRRALFGGVASAAGAAGGAVAGAVGA
jgi:hypothetical protein